MNYLYVMSIVKTHFKNFVFVICILYLRTNCIHLVHSNQFTTLQGKSFTLLVYDVFFSNTVNQLVVIYILEIQFNCFAFSVIPQTDSLANYIEILEFPFIKILEEKLLDFGFPFPSKTLAKVLVQMITII